MTRIKTAGFLYRVIKQSTNNDNKVYYSCMSLYGWYTAAYWNAFIKRENQNILSCFYKIQERISEEE